jgi:DNA polymerase-3 subunit epsilon
VTAPTPPAPACHPEEADLVLAWLAKPGVRLVEVSEPWSMPLRSAQSAVDPVEALAATAAATARVTA